MNVDLLAPDFVRELEALRRRLLVRANSGGAGEHLSRKRGSSAEFRDHRPYAPGDDLRRIDWLAYARTGEPVIKEFRAEEDVLVRLLLDTSGSLEGEKLQTAARIAAAVGYMALASSERVQVLPFAHGALLPNKPLRGRAGVTPLLRTLGALEAEGRTELAASIDAVLVRGRPGLLVIVSDFLDPGAFERGLTRARAAGHDVALVQVLTREELEPSVRGDLLLEDAETGDTLSLTADDDALEAYLARLEGLTRMLRGWARSHRASFVRAITDEPLEHAVRSLVDRRVEGA